MVNLKRFQFQSQKVIVDVVDEPRARRLRVTRVYGDVNSYQVWIDEQLITANTSDDSAIMLVSQILTGTDPYTVKEDSNDQVN